MSENAERERAIKAVGEEGYAARIDEDDYGQRRTPVRHDAVVSAFTASDVEALARAIHDSERTWPAYGDEEFKSIWRDQAREVLSWLHESGDLES